MHPRLIERPRCGMLYGSPVPSGAALVAAYQGADFDSGEEADYASLTYAREIGKIRARLPDLDGSLDIGTGDGSFLARLLSMGFQNVAGVEPSEAPRMLKPEIRQRIKPGLFDPADFSAERFALITCFQTMEHVPDPLGIARGARNLLSLGALSSLSFTIERRCRPESWGSSSDLRYRASSAVQPQDCSAIAGGRRLRPRARFADMESLSRPVLDQAVSHNRARENRTLTAHEPFALRPGASLAAGRQSDRDWLSMTRHNGLNCAANLMAVNRLAFDLDEIAVPDPISSKPTAALMHGGCLIQILKPEGYVGVPADE